MIENAFILPEAIIIKIFQILEIFPAAICWQMASQIMGQLKFIVIT